MLMVWSRLPSAIEIDGEVCMLLKEDKEGRGGRAGSVEMRSGG